MKNKKKLSQKNPQKCEKIVGYSTSIIYIYNRVNLCLNMFCIIYFVTIFCIHASNAVAFARDSFTFHYTVYIVQL